jgi:hypothetical protein
MIVGGIAVIARGVPRLTTDIDATVWGEGLSLRELYSALAAEGIVPRRTPAEELARQRQVLLLVREATGTSLEILLAWRDQDDIERLLVLHGRQVDFQRLRHLMRQLAEAVDEPERVQEFEALAERMIPNGR